MGTTGVIQPTSDRNTTNYVWQSPGNQVEKQPVARLDYNLTDKHRLSGVYNWQVVTRDPDHLNNDDVRFPGLPNYARYVSYRPFTSGGLRSTLSSQIVNELRGGIRWGPGYFGRDDSSGYDTFAGSEFMALDLSNNLCADLAPALAASPDVRGLTRLNLSHNQMGDAGVQALATSDHLRALTALNLTQNSIGDGGAQALAASENLRTLTTLAVGGNVIAARGAQALADSPYLRGCTVYT